VNSVFVTHAGDGGEEPSQLVLRQEHDVLAAALARHGDTIR